VPTNTQPRDRFDDVPRERHRVGAHRAENPRMRAGLIVLWAAVAAVILFAVGVFLSLLWTDRISFGPEPSTPAAVESTAPVGAVDTSYTVWILNAGPDPAQTDRAKSLAVGVGYAEDAVATSEADQQDFATSTVYFSDAADEGPARALASALGIAQVAQSDAYKPIDDSAGRQLTVVLGVDFGADAG
jgi:hypothetical protein